MNNHNTAKRKVLKGLEVLLTLGLFSLPFGQGFITNLLLLSVAVGGIAVMKKVDWLRALRSPIVGFSWLFFLLYLLSLAYTDDLQSGISNIQTKLSFFIAPPILVGIAPFFQYEHRRRFEMAFLLGAVSSLFLALIYASYRAWGAQAWSYIKSGGTQEYYFFLYETFAEPFMHPGYLSTHYGIAVLVLFFKWFKNPQEHILDLLALSFLGFGMFLLQGRMNILALSLVFLGAGFVWVLKLKAWKRVVWTAAGLLSFVYVAFQFSPDSFKERYLALPDFSYDITGSEFNSATYRLAEWKSAWMTIKRAPILGHGIGDDQRELFMTYEDLGFVEGLKRRYNAHNQFLETMLSIGLIGLLSLVLMLLAYASQAWKQKAKLSLAALAFFVLCMLTESVFERAWAIVLFNLYFPLFLSLPESQD